MSDRHAIKGGDGDTSVRVAVRVRPQTEKELNAKEQECITCHVKTRQVMMFHQLPFQQCIPFSNAFGIGSAGSPGGLQIACRLTLKNSAALPVCERLERQRFC